MTVWSDGTLRGWDMCMDTSGGTSSFGTPLVDLEPCNGSATQDWTHQSNGSLQNRSTGSCLDDPGATTTPGTELQLYTCNGSAAQRWTLGSPPDETPPPSPSGGSVCDVYAGYGTPCAAAYSMTRAMYTAYNGSLYQVQRASDGTTAN